MKKLILIAVVAVIAAAVTGIILFNKSHRSTADATSDYIVAAPALLQEFSQDEVAANQKYLDKVVAVQGKVKSVDTDEEGNMNLTLDAADEMAGVICTIPKSDSPDAAKVAIGETVTVKGICTGMLMDVVLIRCVLES